MTSKNQPEFQHNDEPHSLYLTHCISLTVSHSLYAPHKAWAIHEIADPSTSYGYTCTPVPGTAHMLACKY